MKNNNVREIRKSKKERREEKLENLGLVSGICVRVYYGFEEFIWLMVGVGIFVLFVSVFKFLLLILLR